jgi:hypothetical protein
MPVQDLAALLSPLAYDLVGVLDRLLDDVDLRLKLGDERVGSGYFGGVITLPGPRALEVECVLLVDEGADRLDLVNFGLD